MGNPMNRSLSRAVAGCTLSSLRLVAEVRLISNTLVRLMQFADPSREGLISFEAPVMTIPVFGWEKAVDNRESIGILTLNSGLRRC